MKYRLEGARVFDSEKCEFTEKTLFFSNVIEESETSDAIIGASGMFAIPGFVDIHTHGRSGIDIMTASPLMLASLCEEYARAGTTTVFPTVMTSPFKYIMTAVRNIRAAKARGFMGIHLEGPYISPQKPGCHDISSIKAPTRQELAQLFASVSPLRMHVTMAPERDNDGCLEFLRSMGITVGIGHTSATAAETLEALKKGASIFTHTFNAMPPFLHREPGPVGVALASDTPAEFICDGYHLDPITVAAAYNAKSRYADSFVLVTDSIPQTGMADGEYDMNGIRFQLSSGHATKPDGTIVGSTLDMMTAVKNLSRFTGIGFGEALLCATRAPAKAVGIYDTVGSLNAGKRADILLCDGQFNIRSVFSEGRKII